MSGPVKKRKISWRFPLLRECSSSPIHILLGKVDLLTFWSRFSLNPPPDSTVDSSFSSFIFTIHGGVTSGNDGIGTATPGPKPCLIWNGFISFLAFPRTGKSLHCPATPALRGAMYAHCWASSRGWRFGGRVIFPRNSLRNHSGVNAVLTHTVSNERWMKVLQRSYLGAVMP